MTNTEYQIGETLKELMNLGLTYDERKAIKPFLSQIALAAVTDLKNQINNLKPEFVSR